MKKNCSDCGKRWQETDEGECLWCARKVQDERVKDSAQVMILKVSCKWRSRKYIVAMLDVSTLAHSLNGCFGVMRPNTVYGPASYDECLAYAQEMAENGRLPTEERII